MFEIFDRPFADPSQLYLACSPWPMAIITSTYLLFVLKLGRQLMAHRAAFQLRGLLRVYNLMQVIFNGLMLALGVGHLVVFQPHNLSCMTMMPQDHPLKSFERMLSYAYYINKYVDLLDTVFIVLRKSYKQITVLHLWHHLHMPIAGYFVIRFYGYGGHIIVMGILNLFVHVMMYGYYYIASQGPATRSRLWWKQYLTMLQMIQFVLIFVHASWTLMQPNCQATPWISYLMLLMSTTMFLMFTNFYINAYKLPQRKTETGERLKKN